MMSEGVLFSFIFSFSLDLNKFGNLYCLCCTTFNFQIPLRSYSGPLYWQPLAKGCVRSLRSKCVVFSYVQYQCGCDTWLWRTSRDAWDQACTSGVTMLPRKGSWHHQLSMLLLLAAHSPASVRKQSESRDYCFHITSVICINKNCFTKAINTTLLHMYLVMCLVCPDLSHNIYKKYVRNGVQRQFLDYERGFYS